MRSLKGKTLFITGASRGIGRAIALRAAADSANIAIASKTDEPNPKLPGTIHTVADEIVAAGGRALRPPLHTAGIMRNLLVAAALLFAALAPALVMAALWHAAKIASVVFAFTFAIALYHAVFFGLPLFLVFRLKGWINVMSCVVSGFAVGAVPAGIVTWPMQHPDLHMVIAADGWVNYVKPLIYFGAFGALGGFAFWVALISAGIFGRGGGSSGHARANGAASQTWVAPAFANNISTENASTVEPARAFVVLITNDTGSPELEDE